MILNLLVTIYQTVKYMRKLNNIIIKQKLVRDKRLPCRLMSTQATGIPKFRDACPLIFSLNIIIKINHYLFLTTYKAFNL